MHHDICYRDNDTPGGKGECDRKMLAELNALVPKARREKVDRQLVRIVIGLEHRMGMGIHWTNELANELHKPVRRRKPRLVKRLRWRFGNCSSMVILGVCGHIRELNSTTNS